MGKRVKRLSDDTGHVHVHITNQLEKIIRVLEEIVDDLDEKNRAIAGIALALALPGMTDVEKTKLLKIILHRKVKK